MGHVRSMAGTVRSTSRPIHFWRERKAVAMVKSPTKPTLKLETSK